MRSSSSTGFSCGNTGLTILACVPSLSALSRARALPASVLGPVDLAALRLLASICASLAMCASSRCGDESADRETHHGPVIEDDLEKVGSSCVNRARWAILFRNMWNYTG